jgi:hypothetical protein
VALEIINRNNQAHPPIEEESDDIQHIIPIIGTSSSPDEEPEELPIEVDRPFDPNDEMDTQERERIIRQLVERLDKPCAPLLLGYLWDNKSMSDLAAELGYKNADSAKSQKSKCMDKVKTFVKQQLIGYGYGY